MNDTPILSQADFVRRLSSLCSRGALGGIPRDENDQHILMKSAVLMIGEPGRTTSKRSTSGCKPGSPRSARSNASTGHPAPLAGR
jgi:hypothetical protein